MNKLQNLKNNIFTDQSTKANRPYLVEYIKLKTEEAKQLPEEERLAEQGEGWNIASDICGAIAHNCADSGVKHNNWLNEQTEPILSEIMDVTWTLDIDGNHPDEWNKLFDLVKRLK